MKPYDTLDGEKQRCRELFVETVSDNITSPKYFFVLPAENAHDAKLIKQTWPQSRIEGVEVNRKVFNHIEEQHSHIINKMYNETVGDYVQHTKGRRQMPFDAAFLDYTGMPSLKNIKDVCEFVTHLTGQTSVIGITFTSRLLRKTEEIADMMMNVQRESWIIEDEDNPLEDARAVANVVCQYLDEGIKEDGKLVTTPLRSFLQQLDIVHAFKYKSNKFSNTMYFMVLLIKKI